MAYVLGIDLGTSYSAAAVGHADGRTEMFQLGLRAAAMPSLVVVRDSGETLVGEAAERRALTEPARTAREFKRRLGDPVPLILGGTPYGPEALLAILLRAVLSQVAQQLGVPPVYVVITHPASYGAYKLDLLRQAARQADLPATSFVSEPVAAAVHYTSLEQVPSGSTIAVYDFGGGTFDATILRKTDEGFDAIGIPEGLERLGGIDFDEAIFRHVVAALSGRGQAVDTEDPAGHAGFARLREECRRAKEALSADTDASIPISLPGIQTEVRVTRAEFEAMIEPRISETIAALERAARSAGVEMDEIDRILLVGGTSRIPRIAERVRGATRRRVVVDAHPKHGVALGAARFGLVELEVVATRSKRDRAASEVTSAAAPVVAEVDGSLSGEPAAPRVAPVAASGPRRVPSSVAAVLGLAVLLVAGMAMLASGLLAGGGNPSAAPSAISVRPTLPAAPTPLPTALQAQTALITGVTLAGDRYQVAFTTTGFVPAVGGHHVHFFWDTVPPQLAGSPATGPYLVHIGGSPFAEMGPATRPNGASAVCIIVANPDHTVVPASGNCVALP
jgi:actin-like ATPase involved in cell morphogenesis